MAGPPEDSFEPLTPPVTEEKEDSFEPLTKPIDTGGGITDLIPQPVKTAWNWANTPLTTLPSRAMNAIAGIQTSPINERLAAMVGLQGPYDWYNNLARSGLRATGELASGLTTPLNLATAGTATGENIAARLGYSGAELGLNLATKALSAPLAAEGAYKVATEPTWTGKAMGGLEALGGAAGLAHGPYSMKLASEEAAPVASTVAEAAAPETLAPEVAAETAAKPRVRLNTVDGKSNGTYTNLDNGNILDESGNVVGHVSPTPKEKWSYNANDNTYTNKSTGNIHDANGVKIGNANEPALPVPILSKELAGAKPRYNRGGDSYLPQFDNDIDKSLYIIANQNISSKREADYMKFLVDATGLDETMIRGLAQEFKAHVKDTLKYEKPGEVDIPSKWNVQDLMKGKVTTAPPSAGLTPLPTATGGSTGVPPIGGPKPPPIPEAIPAGKQLIPPVPKPVEVAHPFLEAYNLPKGLMSADYPFVTSAAFRQASYHAFTRPWFRAWNAAARAFGSKAAYEEINSALENMPYFKRRLEPMRTATGKLIYDANGEIKTKIIPSIADMSELQLSDVKSLKTREEIIGSNWAEKVPVYGRYIAASNRAYTAFLNTVRAHAFTNIAEGLKAEGRDIATDTVLGKELGKMINTTTGRSPLKLDIPFTGKLGFGKRLEADFERSADVLNFAMFSPRNYMTNVRMLNPWTYSNAPAGVRQQYVYAMLRKVGAWSSMLFLGNMIGGKTNYDPNNADFMKLHFPGGTRIDPGGGLQQFMVLAHRLLPEALGGGGISSSAEGPNYGKFMPFGYGYKPETRKTTTINFMVSHAHPTVGLAAQAADATQYRPFYPVDEAIKRIVPMFSSDVMDVVNQHPDLGSIVKGIATGFASSIGMGAQTYEKGSNPSFTKLPIIGKAAEYRIPPPGHRF